MVKTKSNRGAVCPYCDHKHVETSAWGNGDYTQTCSGCGKKFDLTVKVTRTYIGYAADTSEQDGA